MPEAGAYRFALRTAVALLPALVAGLIWGPLPGILVALVGVAAAGAWSILAHRRSPRIRTAPKHLGPPEELRLLVVANDTLGDELAEVVRRRIGGGPAKVLLLAPVAVPALSRWSSATDAGHAELARRLAAAATLLDGVVAKTVVVDDEPLQAVEDALRTFGADEVLVVTHSERSELARRAYERFAVPVSHVALPA